jgi:glycosyltransferase involved in cell wall biosynthesis
MSLFVSCSMVTRPSPERLVHVKRSINYYLQQTHANRELVIVLDEGPEPDKIAIEEHVAGLERGDLRVVRADGAPTLGRLRNLAIEAARGEVVAVWDDDDIHNPRRLALQVAALQDSGAIATFLSEALHLFCATREVYWTNYKNTEQKCLPGTGLFKRSVLARYPESGASSQRGEDTSFCLRLLAEGAVHFMDDSAQLYTYVSHGRNTSGNQHHQMLARELGVSRGRLMRRETQVREALVEAEFGLPEVSVQASNGVAFVWRAA